MERTLKNNFESLHFIYRTLTYSKQKNFGTSAGLAQLVERLSAERGVPGPGPILTVLK